MEEPIPRAVRDSICGLALAAAAANVIMQLSRLPIGHGVALSTVDSGRVDKHPIKRLRTTSSFLAVSMLGTEQERLALRAEINRQHVPVRSQPGDAVQYNAFDPELQLWVAACLYKGGEDIYRLLFTHAREDQLDDLYRHGIRFGTTLQVKPEMWPPDRVAFDEYWRAGVAQIEMDDLTRGYLRGIAGLEFLGAPVAKTLGPLNRFLTLGFLPQPFRDELGLPWDERRQRRFEAGMKPAAALTRGLPRPLREFPFNAYLWDTRRRIRSGHPIV